MLIQGNADMADLKMKDSKYRIRKKKREEEKKKNEDKTNTNCFGHRRYLVFVWQTDTGKKLCVQ